MTSIHNASTTTFVWLVSICLLLLVIVGTAVTLHACKPSYRALEPSTSTTIQHSAPPSSCCSCTNSSASRHSPTGSGGAGTSAAGAGGISSSSFQSGISTTGLVDTPTGCGIVTNEDPSTSTMGARRSWSERVASAASATATSTSNNNQQQQQQQQSDIIDTSDNNLKSCSASTTTMFNNCYVSSVQHVPCLTSNNSLVSATTQDISTTSSTAYSAAACCCPQFVEPHTVHQHSSSCSTTHPDKMLQVAQSAATLQPACSSSSHTAALRAHEQHLLSRSAQHSARINLPPSISVPETHRNVFRYHVPDQAGEVTQRCIRPPPNRTVYDRESPPPYQHLHTEHGGHTPLLLHRSSHSSSRATTLLESDVISESSCSVDSPSPSLSLQSSSTEHRV